MSARPPLRRDLRLILLDGVMFSAMVGLGETYLAPFTLALGFNEVLVGLVSTVPMVAGGLLQLAAPSLVRLARSIRAWTASWVALQALAFAPLIAAAALGRADPWVVFLAASIYWGAGMASAPAWNAWMILLIPARVRSRYFARRQSASQFGVLGGLIGGGLLLELCRQLEQRMLGFTLLFSAALLFRLVSARLLMAHSLPFGHARPAPLSIRTIVRVALASDRRDMVLCLALVSAAVYLGGPFLTPYQLVKCQMHYGGFMAQLAVFIVVKMIAYRVLGRFVRRLDLKLLLALGGAGVTPLPLLWLVSTSPVYFASVQVLSGVSWAAFELGTLLSFLDVADERERSCLLVAYNALNSLAIAAASLVGGLALEVGGHDWESYAALFVACAVARAIALVAVLYRARHAAISMMPAIRTIAVRPWGGGVVTAVLATLGRRRRDDEG